jgi:hypothetical protein
MTSLQNKKQYIVIIIPFRWRKRFDLHQIIAEHPSGISYICDVYIKSKAVRLLFTFNAVI